MLGTEQEIAKRYGSLANELAGKEKKLNKTLFQMYRDTHDEIGSVSEDFETVLRVI